jgi:rhodanese-related sulfurtransferase
MSLLDNLLQPHSTMKQVLELFPGAQRALFRKYHIGGCSSCGFQPTETLDELCKRNDNLNVSEVIDHIKSSHEQDRRMMIPPLQLAQLLNENRGINLLDIRTREEWEVAHIAGAALFTQDLMQDILAHWSREDLVVIYDHVGAKGLDAAAYFMGHQFKNVKCLQGGIDAWAAEMDPKMPRYNIQQR